MADKKHPKYDPNIAAEQKKLKDKGFYTGEIDGVEGPATQAARQRFTTSEAEKEDRELRRLELQTRATEADAKKTAADTAGSEAEESKKRKAEMEAWNNSTEGVLYNVGNTAGAPVGGAVAGHAAGHMTSKLIDAMTSGRADSLDEVVRPMRDADLARVPNDPALRAQAQGTVNAAKQYMPKTGLRGAVEKGLATGARGAAYFGPAAMLAAEGFGLRQNAVPSDDENFRMWGDLQQAGGTGMIAAGAGMGFEGGRRMFFPPKDPSGYAGNVSRIEQLKAALDPPPAGAIPRPAEVSPALQDARAAAPAAEEPIRHSERLKLAAKAAGGKARSSKRGNVDLIRKSITDKNMPDVAEALKLPRDADRRTILQRLREVSNIGGKMAIPLAVGSYMAATGDSEAADASTAERAGDAAGNFAVGAGGAYGGMKAIDALAKAAPMAMRALGSGAAMAMPGEMVGMTDWSQEQLNAGRNTAARVLPEALQFGAIDEARQMATVPERNPERAPYPSKLITRVQRMKKQGASPDQIANWLNKAMP